MEEQDLAARVKELERDLANAQEREKALAEASGKFRNMLNSMDDLLFVINKEREITGFFQEEKIEELHRPIRDILEHHIDEIYTPGVARKINETIDNVFKTGQTQNVEYMIWVKGERRYYCSNISPVWVDGEIDDLIMVQRDITEKKRVEKELKKLIKEQKILFKEYGHRAKNYFTNISSMMYLAIDKVTDGQSGRLILADFKNRIDAVAKIFENLYSHGEIIKTNLKDYIEGTAASLQSVYGNDEQRKINIRTDIEDIEIGSNDAMYIGCLINEVIMNSIKYAFIGREQGEIYIDLRRENGNYLLEIGDNGLGKPSDTEPGLGSMLIDNFVTKLNGDIDMYVDKGTHYTIRFKPTERPLPDKKR